MLDYFFAKIMPKREFMVFGLKNFPIKDTKTEKDNPYIFSSLERAKEVAVKKLNIMDIMPQW